MDTLRKRHRTMRILNHTLRQPPASVLRIRASPLTLMPTAQTLYRLIIISRKNGLSPVTAEGKSLKLNIIELMVRGPLILQDTRCVFHHRLPQFGSLNVISDISIAKRVDSEPLRGQRLLILRGTIST